MRCDEGKGKRGDYKKYVVGDTLDTFRTLLFRKKSQYFKAKSKHFGKFRTPGSPPTPFNRIKF